MNGPVRTSAGTGPVGSSSGGGGTEPSHSRSWSRSWVSSATSPAAYAYSGDQNSASNGQTSTQIPQYMHSAKSIANRSSTLTWRGRPPPGGSTVSLCESM